MTAVPRHARVGSVLDGVAGDRRGIESAASGRNDPSESVVVLRRARADLPAAVATAGPATYVPWQDCSLPTDVVLVVRLREIVVHADDLAAGVGRAAPAFDDDVTHPAVARFAMLSTQRHGAPAAVRTLARTERAGAPAGAGQGPTTG